MCVSTSRRYLTLSSTPAGVPVHRLTPFTRTKRDRMQREVVPARRSACVFAPLAFFEIIPRPFLSICFTSIFFCRFYQIPIPFAPVFLLPLFSSHLVFSSASLLVRSFFRRDYHLDPLTTLGEEYTHLPASPSIFVRCPSARPHASVPMKHQRTASDTQS